MIDELETVILTRDIPESGLTAGDVGAVVHRYAGGAGYEVEFVTGEGRTVAVLALSEGDLRPMSSGEILHVRSLVPT
ncbi:MAG TPA: DUF4926 domain-containing protein [Candidatus Sulfotelmatobacter sp.]|nr:DUF4926 domain-containing protein [Candidatus Sulfotelmatobacter sp.]